MDWQSITAAAIVALTAALFLARLLTRRKSGNSCGTSCDCAGKPANLPRALAIRNPSTTENPEKHG
jgi:hypothetical protein